MPMPKTIDIPPLGPNIKSTFASFTSAAIACIVAFTALPDGAKWPVVALAILHALNGLFQKDAGVVEALTATGEVKAVASHELPNDPTATPVEAAQPQPEPLHSAVVVKGPKVS